MKTLMLSLIALLAFTSTLAAQEASPKTGQIAATPIGDLASWQWTDRQFLQADKAGRVFLLREETLDLYQISPTGTLIPKGRLGGDDPPKDRRPAFEAAMSLSGDAWVLLSFPNHLEVYQGGKRTDQLEAPWMVSAVAAGQGEPLVAVMPAEMASAAPATLRLDVPPLLQTWDGKRWDTLAEGQFPGERPDGATGPEQLRGEFGVFLAATPERHLWMADEHAYRLRHFSPAGTLKDELVVGDGKVQWRERTNEEWSKAETAAQRGGIPFNRRSLSSVRAEEVVRAMAAGRDGVLYLIVRTEKGLALDRFQPALLTLERVLLQGIAEDSGRLTMAAGAQGLIIDAHGTLSQIDAEALDKAEWQPVHEAVLNGQPLVPVKKEKTTDPSLKTARP